MCASELLSVRGLSYSWNGLPVVREVSFDLGEEEFLVLLGPNGSGKTTLLRLLVGLEVPGAGSVRLRGRALEHVPTHRRGIGWLSQDPELFPDRTVWENIAYGPQVQRLAPSDVEARVAELVGLLRLDGLVDRLPEELSGGERHRAALARALAPHPALVLLDEPFSSVDPQLRRELRAEFRRVLAARQTAAIFVTHDRDEGLFLGDRVAVLLDGRIRQIGPPAEVMGRPVETGVARFLGYNVFTQDGRTLAVAPGDLRLDAAGGPGVEARVLAHGWSPQGTAVLVRGADGSTWELLVGEGAQPPPVGRAVRLSWRRATVVATE